MRYKTKIGYAVVGYFDINTDKRIKTLWKSMADIGVCDYLINSANNPHIKLAMYHSLNIEQAKEDLNELCNKQYKTDVHFKSYSFYPGDEPFICLDASPSYKLLDLQAKVNEVCDISGEKDNRGFFDNGIWKPDCQLTVRIYKERLAKIEKATRFLCETELPFDGVLERIGIIEFHPAEQLFDFSLL